ncbi:MAG: hypothetical protein ABSA65_03125 [Acidimicrobiales bacterium]
MTDRLSLPRRRTQRRVPAAVGSGLTGLALVAFATVLSSCGASTALGNAVLAPLSALSATDVVLETNLQYAVTGGYVEAGISGSSGNLTTSGPPTTPRVVSVASATGVSVYTAFNPLDRHCLGSFVLAPGAPSAVLGETAPDTYDFWFGPTTAVDCTASVFTTETQVPSGWAAGDPSTSWPNS